MKKYFICFIVGLFILNCFSSKAQFIERQLISSFGNLSETPELIISATGGEISIQTIRSTDIIFTVGFQQPNPGDIVSTDDPGLRVLEIILSPNPMLQNFNICFETNLDFEAYYSIWDAEGKSIIRTTPFQLNSISTLRIDCSSWEGGSYYLTIYDEQKLLIKSLKVLKL